MLPVTKAVYTKIRIVIWKAIELLDALRCSDSSEHPGGKQKDNKMLRVFQCSIVFAETGRKAKFKRE